MWFLQALSFNVVQWHCTMLPTVQKHNNVSYTITHVVVFNTHSRAKDWNYRQSGLKIHKALVGGSETFWARVLSRSRSMATSYLGTWDLSVVAFDDCCKSGFSLSRNLKCCGYLSGGYQRILQVENISRIRLITKARRITAATNRSKDQRLGHDDSSKKRR